MILQLVLSAVSGLATSGLLVWSFKEWLSVRLKASIQHEYDRKLEAFKTELKTQQELAFLNINTSIARETVFHSEAHAAFAAGQKASMERKLSAVDRVWKCVLQLRAASPLLKLIDVMKVDEYERAKEHPDFRKLTDSLSLENLAALVPKDIEEARPYIGEYMWSVFISYQTILIRILLLVHYGETNAEKIHWHKEEGTRRVIEVVLTAQELQAFDQTEFGKASLLLQRLESKMLFAAQKVISGEAFGAESLQQATAIQQHISRLSAGKVPGVRQGNTLGPSRSSRMFCGVLSSMN